MKVIGFANKFYTLWEVTEETRNLGNGRSYLITHFTYIKNISFDKETALAKYPGVSIDENLKGHTESWSIKKEVWDNVDTFRFGKYVYQNIEKVNDITYTEWYWANIDYESDHGKFVQEFLEKNGYEFREISYLDYYGKTKTILHLYTPAVLKAEKEAKEKNSMMIEKLKNNEELNIEVVSNPNEDGEIVVNDIIYKFQEVKENYYNGFTYYLPILNGKQKRIKNKNIKITKYSWKTIDENVIITIEDFEIIK